MCEVQCDEQWSFTRAFSALGKLQSEYFLQYSCSKIKTGLYSFKLKRQCRECSKEENAIVQNITGKQAHQIVQYLFENAIPFETWKDVLSELQELV